MVNTTHLYPWRPLNESNIQLEPIEISGILSILIEYRMKNAGRPFSFDIDRVITMFQTEASMKLRNEHLREAAKIYYSKF